MSGYFKGTTPATSYVDVCGFDPDDRTSVWTWKDSTLYSSAVAFSMHPDLAGRR